MEGVGYEIWHTLEQCREEVQARLQILFQMDGNSIGVIFGRGMIQSEVSFTKISMAALYKRMRRWNIETGTEGVEEPPRRPGG